MRFSGRFLTLFLLHTAYVVHRRFALSTNAIAHDFGLSTAELGCFVTAHACALTVSKLVLGAASDRLSPKRLLLAPLLLLGAAVLLLSTTSSKIVLLAVIVASAALQGAAWPVCVAYLQRWLKGGPMGGLFSLLSSTTTVGGLALAAAGGDEWRGVAEKIGYSSFVLVLFSWFVLDEKEEEREVDRMKKKEGTDLLSSLKSIVGSGAVWRLSLLYGLAMMTRTIAETWLPLFTHDAPTIQYYFEIGGLFGSLASGAAVDAAARALVMGSEPAARHLLCATTSGMLIVTSWLVLALADTTSPPSVPSLSLMSLLSGGAVYASINIACLVCASMAPGGRSSGTTTALVSFLAQIGSILAGSPIAWLLQTAGRAALAPALSIGVVAVAGVVWSNKPFLMEDNEKKEEEEKIKEN